MDSKGRNLHNQAEIARESGDFLKALELTDQATLAYQEDHDILGMAEIQASRFITFKHLYQQTQDKNYLILGKLAASAAVEIARQSHNKQALALPLFNLGKAHAEAGEWEEAVSAYQESVENMEKNPPELHNRPAVLLDIKGHMYIAQYKLGDKEALEKAKEAVEKLEQTEELSDYNKNVWLTGAHMRIAEALGTDDLEKAEEHLQKAKDIIFSDDRLKLRAEQWNKLKESLKPNGDDA